MRGGRAGARWATFLGAGLVAATAAAGPAGSTSAPPGAVAASSPEPQRVVSLVPAATESLFALGVGHRVVGVSSFDHWPPKVETLPRLGALVDPDAERILALEPDLVVLDPSQRALERQLESVGIAAYAWGTGDLEDLYGHLLRLGGELGVTAAAEELTTSLRERLASVAASAPPDRPRVLLVFGRRPGSFAGLWVSGGVGFLHQLLQIAGGDNRFTDVQLQGFKTGLETLLAEPPDVVIELASGAVREKAAAGITAEWRALPGFGEVRVGVLTDPALLIPGPRVVELAEKMAAIIRR